MDPLALVAGGILAAILGVAIFDDDDDDNNSDDTDTDVENSEGLTLDEATGTVTGTDDDDVITTSVLGDSPDTYGVVYGGAGDDTILADPGYEAHGEEGDDVLTVIGAYGGVTDGGAGDDVLNVAPLSSVVLGGEGNDTINYNDLNRGWDEGNQIDAGDGDDVINSHMNVGASWSGVALETGDGTDEVNLTLDLEDVSIDSESGTEFVFDGSGLVASVADFDPQNDVLTIDPTAYLDTGDGDAELNGEAADISYTGYEVVEDDAGTTVFLNYDAISSSETVEMALQVRLTGATGIPADGIRIITG